MPADAVDDGPADDRAERDPEARDAAPETDCRSALLGRERLADQGQRERHYDRAADALQRPRPDQHARARRQCRGRGRGAEQEDADREHAPATEAVPERSTGQQEAGEGEVVGVDGPLQALEAGVQVSPQRR
jgi:hypothetical protein